MRSDILPMCWVPYLIDQLREAGPPVSPPNWKHSHGLLAAVRPWVNRRQYRAFKDELLTYGTEAIGEVVARVHRDGFDLANAKPQTVKAIRDRMPVL